MDTLKHIRHWLVDQGITQIELARQMGYSKEYVSRVLRGRVPLTNEFEERQAKVEQQDGNGTHP